MEEKILNTIKAIVIKTNTALKLQATKTFVDRKNIKRKAGEEWLIRETGSFLPDIFEDVVEIVSGTILNDKKCIHLRAMRNFTDVYNIQRKAGSEWLIKNTLGSVHIKDVYE